jgi:F-type H+-transporting ATPase subunit b
MEFDLTTSVLEVLNFLVLVWLLKRFLYQPVLAVIERRQAATAKIVADAEALRGKAQGLKREYTAHLAQLDGQRAAAEARLEAELAAERSRRLAALDAELAAERSRREALAERALRDREAALERQAMTIAARFAARLLDRLAGPELNASLADLALGDLAGLTDDQRDALRAALTDPGASIKVVSAYPLDEGRRAAFTQALGALTGRAVTPEFTDDTLLKAGVCIMAGAWVLMANLRDELGFFSGSLEHGG